MKPENMSDIPVATTSPEVYQSVKVSASSWASCSSGFQPT